MGGTSGMIKAARREAAGRPRSCLFWWLMAPAPAATLAIISLLLGSGALRELPMALCDLDNSPLSRQTGRWVDAAPSMRIARVAASPEEGNRLLRAGKVFGLVIVPRHFERDMLRKRPVRVIAYIEGQHMAAAGILSRDLTDIGLSFWKEQDTITRARAGVPPASALAQASTISLDLRPVANPGINYRLFLLPGLLPAILQLCVALAAVCVLHRLAALRLGNRDGAAPWRVAAGSFAPVVLWYWLLACGLASILRLRGDLVLQGSFGTLALAYLLFILAGAALGMLIYGMTDTLIQSLSVVSAFSSPAFAFAGLTFPLLSMPLPGRMWAALLPVTHLVKIQVACGQLGSSPWAQRAAFLSLALLTVAMGSAGLILAALRVGRERERAGLAPRDAGESTGTGPEGERA